MSSWGVRGSGSWAKRRLTVSARDVTRSFYAARLQNREPDRYFKKETAAPPVPLPRSNDDVQESSKRRSTSQTRVDADAGAAAESHARACTRSNDRSSVAKTRRLSTETHN